MSKFGGIELDKALLQALNKLDISVSPRVRFHLKLFFYDIYIDSLQYTFKKEILKDGKVNVMSLDYPKTSQSFKNYMTMVTRCNFIINSLLTMNVLKGRYPGYKRKYMFDG